ncbi:MAG: hypothetical protein AB7F59_04835 [Bdellovibrionales bacterium]
MIKQVFRFSFTDAFIHTLEMWRRSWAPLLALTCFFEGFGWLSLRLLAENQISQQIFQALWSLAVESVFLLIIPKLYKDWLEGKPPQPVWPHVKKHVEPFTIESLRVLGRVSIGFLLLIVPGLIRAIQYYFVGYIIQFDPRYERGEVDALEASKALVQGRFFLVLGVLIWILALSLLGQLRDLTSLSEIATSAAFVLMLFLRVYMQIVLYYFYSLLQKTRP